MEERVLERWRDREVFRRSLEQRGTGPLFRFYEGPPTANGRPGVHHVEARVFKDVFLRYRTMKGDRVPRKAGWDCHGIPVELEVERELGISNKKEIEELGIAGFNARCRASVQRYAAEFARVTERIGYWVDTDDAYWTMSRAYVESVWWSLKILFERGLVYEDDRVVPYCPRCGTAVSDHEVAQGYREAEDPSIYVRFPILTGPLREQGAALLIWTTMPWTLVPATLAVVGPDIPYVLARGGAAAEHPVVLSAARLHDVLGEAAEVIREVPVEELRGARYQPPFDFVGPGSPSEPEGDPSTWRFVVVDDFVKTDEGTGVVHTGAAFGEDDMRVARLHGTPVVRPVTEDGRFDERIGPYAGMYVRDADAHIIEELRDRGLLVRAGRHTHTYPFCWRCETPLLYFATPGWFIATTRIRDRLLEENESVDWRPAHIRTGRFGDWLEGNVDWALSRDRYWGTPLPFWRCRSCDRIVAVGSVADLEHRAGRSLEDLDPHRPDVDGVEFPCEKCGGIMQRVPQVIDAWYDSGAMPFAQFGYPHVPGSERDLETMLPADYIAEGIDQTRGWFYSLLAISTMLFDHTSYRRAFCLGHIVDAEGRKMSKAAGNALDPWALIDAYGADALRWLFLVEGSPWQPRRVSDDLLAKVVRGPILTLWNVYAFFVTYANLAGWDPGKPARPVHERTAVDRWLLAELADMVAVVDAGLADFDAAAAGRRLAGFVDDLSNWYVRVSRRRFSGRGQGGDHDAAFATLHTCLTTVVQCMAPLAPFLADEMYENLMGAGRTDAPGSVHLTDFPASDPTLLDNALRQGMSLARRLVSLGRDARTAARIAVRRPLRAAMLSVPAGSRHLIEPLKDLIAGELNVHAVQIAAEGWAPPTSVELRPNFRTLGRAFGARMPAVTDALAAAPGRSVLEAIRERGAYEIDVQGDPCSITAEHIEVREAPEPGWKISSDGPYRVALDVTVDRELALEGLARELIRAVNDARKRRGLELGAPAAVWIAVKDDPEGDAADMLTRYADLIAGETLAHHFRYSLLDGPDSGEALRVGTPAEREEEIRVGTALLGLGLEPTDVETA